MLHLFIPTSSMRIVRLFLLSCIALLFPLQSAIAQDSFFDVFFEIDTQTGQPDNSLGGLQLPGSGDFAADSFFDVFFEIEIPELLDCNPCDALKAELEEAQQEAEEIAEDLLDSRSDLSAAKAERARIGQSFEDANRLLEDLTNPRSWVESEGRRIDTSDLRVMEAYNAELWGLYQSDLLTSDEYQQRLRDGLTDAERESRKQEMIKNLRNRVKELEDRLDDARENEEEIAEEIEELEDELADVQKRIADLMQKLEDCLKKCLKGPVDIIGDYGMGQTEGPGFFGGIFDWIFGREPEPPRDTPAVDLPIPPLGMPLPPFPFPPEGLGGPPIILPPQQLGPDIVLPPFPLILPECDECDELLQMILAIEDELDEMGEDLDELSNELLAAQFAKSTAETDLKSAQQRLDRFNNPNSWAESGGRRIDSTDLEIMREYNRGLWQQYRNGDLSAQELEQKWEEGLPDADRERLEEQRRQQLEKEVADAKKELDEASEDVDALEQIISDAMDATNDLIDALEDLKEEYEKCLKKCMEKKEVKIGGFDVLPPIFEDGFESGDTSRWSSDTPPSGGTVTFGDGVVIPAGGSVDVNDLLKKSDQFDPQTGQLDLGGLKFEFDDQNNLIPDGGDDVSIDLEPDDDKGFFCGTIGLFCPEPEDTDLYTFDLLVDCVIERSEDSTCAPFDANEDGQVNLVDVELVALSLKSVEPIAVDLDISGMDGDDTIGIPDLQLFNDCLIGAPGACDGLQPDVNIGGGLDALTGAGDFDLLLGGGPGDDLLLGDPLDDLVGVGGLDDVGAPGAPTIPDDFFGPGSDPFSGEVPLSGGPGDDGIDLLYFGTTDRTVGLEWPDNDPPPPPVVPEPSQLSPEEVPQSVRDVVARIIRDNPLGPCERLIINVRRIRIGNRVSYTVTATRTRDPEACPQCDKDGGYSSMEECQAGCSNPETCGYDGGTCWECDEEDEPLKCDKDGGYSSMEECQAGCPNPDTCGYDGGLCWDCDESDDDSDLCEDIDCDDGDECTVADTCVNGDCAGAPRNCDDQNLCTTDSCNSAVPGGCVYANNDLPCDDSDVCTLGDTCMKGSCVAGLGKLFCSDAEACTKDECDSLTGCSHTPLVGACEDGNLCTVGDWCESGKCNAGLEQVQCDDGNPCTQDACSPELGCLFEPVATQCDDKDACTIGDFCSNGLCIPGKDSPDCDDGNPCTANVCEPGSGCASQPTTASCDDTNACTVGDHCLEGACMPGADALDCDDGNICSDDWCIPESGCAHTDNSVVCDDANECTEDDTCLNGICQGSLKMCDDANPCTDDGCDPDLVGGCTHPFNDIACEDGDPCTLGDTCADGQCQSGFGKADCDDEDPCTVDFCVQGDGCYHAPQDGLCDDGNVCSVDDYCVGGVCVGGANVCACQNHEDCADEDDGNVCNGTLICDKSAPAPVDWKCVVDLDTIVVCSKENDTTCREAQCQSATGACLLIAVNSGGACDDGSVCSVTEQCDDGECVGSEMLDCADDDNCTDDYCHPTAGCQHGLSPTGFPCGPPGWVCQLGQCVWEAK